MRRRQKVFIEEYLRCWNATKAAKIAGYSEETAYSQGSRLLSNVEVRVEIDRRLSEKAMSADEVLARLEEHAKVDLADFIKKGGGIDWEAVEKKGYLVKKIKHNLGKNSEIELQDSQHALELLGKAHRLFVEKYEVDSKLSVIGLDALLEKAYGNNDTGS